MFTTKVTWEQDKPTSEQFETIIDHVQTLIAQGVTNGRVMTLPDDQYKVILRTWETEEAANNWVSFITPFGPISAEVVI